MMYQAYQARAEFMKPVRAMARIAATSRGLFSAPANFVPRTLVAGCELLGRAGLSHKRPAYRVGFVLNGEREVEVGEEATHATPFGTLLHFKKAAEAPGPRVLLVAPMSGHFATLLRGTVRTLLREHDVYITDWHNARNVNLQHGPFGFDDFIDHVIAFIELLGPGTHVIAVCQPCVAVLAAVAIMAASSNPAQPRSMTLMGGPIDTRVNPTTVNKLALAHPIEWFERHLINRVPLRYPGAMRRVYPGFLQLMAFMSMNPERHRKAHLDLLHHLVKGETQQADAIREFYDEYFAVMDLPAEFYLETVRVAFQEHLLPLGKLRSRDRPVEPSAIRRTALLTVEGEKDDICSVGQTVAAQDLCGGLRPYLKRHHVQTGVGHYGVFNGRRWESGIYPIVRHIIHAND
jgi:polyhydroxyalkanoate depolymerase